MNYKTVNSKHRAIMKKEYKKSKENPFESNSSLVLEDDE